MSQRVFFPTPAGLFALRADLHYSRALSLRSKLHKATQDAWIHLGIDTGSRCLETFARAGGAVRTADEAITGTRPFAEPPCNERQLEGPSYQAACHVAVLLEALRLLRVASGLQGGPMSTRDWVITGAVQGRQIGPIGELKKKLAAITAAVHDAQLRPRPLLVVPTSQVDEARSALAAAQAARPCSATCPASAGKDASRDEAENDASRRTHAEKDASRTDAENDASRRKVAETDAGHTPSGGLSNVLHKYVKIGPAGSRTVCYRPLSLRLRCRDWSSTGFTVCVAGNLGNDAYHYVTTESDQ